MQGLEGVFWPYRLVKGHSADPAEGACAMAAVSWLVHGVHSDQPPCACPVIGRYVMVLNDGMPERRRQMLLPYLHRIAGSRSAAHEAARAAALVRGVARTVLPAGLAALGACSLALEWRAYPDDVPLGTIHRSADGWLRNASAHAPGWMMVDYVREAAGVADAAFAGKLAAGAVRSLAEALAPKANRIAALPGVPAAPSSEALWAGALAVLDAALSAGPQGEAWSAVAVEAAAGRYRAAAGAEAAAPAGAA